MDARIDPPKGHGPLHRIVGRREIVGGAVMAIHAIHTADLVLGDVILETFREI